jgi:diguanylate cyclase (GGDEF)-like protein
MNGHQVRFERVLAPLREASENRRMPEEPRSTVKFPRVLPVEAPPASPPQSPVSNDRLSQPSAPPAWSEDPPTIRGIQVALPAPAASPTNRVLTVLLGVNAGQVFTLDRDETLIGRGRDANIVIDEVGISRRHARIRRADGGRHILEDLDSTNGVFVNSRRVERADLADGDRIQVGPAVLLRFGLVAADEEALARQLYEGATRDALTRLYNRKYATERLGAEVAYAHRHATPLSVILFDIDHFKRVNDTFGHAAGDAVLRILSAQAQKTIRGEDVLARYGGEEFVVIVRGIEHRSAMVLADRIRKSVERLSIPWDSGTLTISISAGVASLGECGPKAPEDALVSLADERLYRAKAGGRNRVC